MGKLCKDKLNGETCLIFAFSEKDEQEFPEIANLRESDNPGFVNLLRHLADYLEKSDRAVDLSCPRGGGCEGL